MKRQHRIAGLLAAAAISLSAVPMFSVAANCFGGCPPPPTPTPAPIVLMPTYHAINMDTSVSFNDSDVGVVLYKVQGDADNIKMDVYGLKNGGSESSYLFSISQADLAAYAKHPAKDTLLASMGDVSVYLLTTGEIQVNAGPDSEGKMHVKILDGIPWTTVYGYTVDAQ